ncbi:MAG TPA: hypothetical protein VEA69_02500 [Tepidisphaeraceae bacterium]|nr:hypothetical protein [Tepidisphaeraceae bacterium]
MPLRRFALLTIVLAIACAGTRPASAEVKPDPSTPKGAAAALFKAMQAGDVAAVRPLVVGSDRQVALFEAMIPLTSAFKSLETAAVKKFGPEGKQINGGGPGAATPTAELEDELETALEKIDGDTAELTPKPVAATGNAGKTVVAKPPMKLKKIGESWKIDLASMPTEKLDTPASIALVKSMGTLARDTAKEIDDGKYKTVDEARLAFQQKLLPVILQAAAADQAATGAASPPVAEEKPKAPDPK